MPEAFYPSTRAQISSAAGFEAQNHISECGVLDNLSSYTNGDFFLY
jgi:hypothetical protein